MSSMSWRAARRSSRPLRAGPFHVVVLDVVNLPDTDRLRRAAAASAPSRWAGASRC